MKEIEGLLHTSEELSTFFANLSTFYANCYFFRWVWMSVAQTGSAWMRVPDEMEPGDREGCPDISVSYDLIGVTGRQPGDRASDRGYSTSIH